MIQKFSLKLELLLMSRLRMLIIIQITFVKNVFNKIYFKLTQYYNKHTIFNWIYIIGSSLYYFNEIYVFLILANDFFPKIVCLKYFPVYTNNIVVKTNVFWKFTFKLKLDVKLSQLINHLLHNV